MRKLLLIPFSLMALQAPAQVLKARDNPNIGQTWRMVHKRWDYWKPGGARGFFYWQLLHGEYRNGEDLRPLSLHGPYTKAIGLIALQVPEENSYENYTASIRDKHISEDLNNQGGTADLPWNFYYREVFDDFQKESDRTLTLLLSTGHAKAVQWLVRSHQLAGYEHSKGILVDRILALHKAYLDRGSRILAYQRLAGEFEALNQSFRLMVHGAILVGKLPFQNAREALPFLTRLYQKEHQKNESAAQYVWRVWKF
ncbi:hypothetical protein V9K67_21740 [Paraflavisolibacter sp. H34]|uniref:hypothetical protein n=1 Tax=Huijunlia imazamoxiresistens TaxID=3127457 RepID=UPI003017A4EC